MNKNMKKMHVNEISEGPKFVSDEHLANEYLVTEYKGLNSKNGTGRRDLYIHARLAKLS
jgi:hypothetical protein